MKNLNFLAMIMAIGVTDAVLSQEWVETGNLVNGTEWFGALPSSTEPLRLRHDGNKPIEMHTNGSLRMIINPSILNGAVNGYYGLDFSGNVGINTYNPWSLLHIDGGTTSDFGYRPWMKNGTLITSGDDLSYFGLRDVAGDGPNEVIIGWGDNTTPPQGNKLRFMYYKDPSSGTFGAYHTNGLEVIRILPNYVGTRAYVGFGDWENEGAGAEPDELIDLIHHTIRVRDFSDAAGTWYGADFDRFVVVNPVTGRFHWRDLPGIGNIGLIDCEWDMQTSPFNHLSTAFGPVDPDCPDRGDAVGIGINLAGITPSAKLNIDTREFSWGIDVHSHKSAAQTIGGKFYVSSGIDENIGVQIDAVNFGELINNNWGVRLAVDGSTRRSYGVRSDTDGAIEMGCAGWFASSDPGTEVNGVWGTTYNGMQRAFAIRGEAWSGARDTYGVSGIAYGSQAPNTTYYGVYGEAIAQDPESGLGQKAFGVFGRAPFYNLPPNINNSWAGYFAGDVYCTNTYYGSDAALKTNVEDLSNAGSILMELQPRSYDYLASEFPSLGLRQGIHRGLIAQELEEVLPDLVQTIHNPAYFDSLGVEVHPAFDFKGVNYIGLIPILIAGHQEQQVVIEQQEAIISAQDSINQAMNDRLDQLEELLALCCQNPIDPDERDMIEEENGIAEPTVHRNLRIQPNPFNEQTTLYYTLERSGRMQLMANSSDGKQLRVLQDAHMEAGAYQYEWTTTDLISGIYYVTLLLDGEHVVKKAVKVN